MCDCEDANGATPEQNFTALAQRLRAEWVEDRDSVLAEMRALYRDPSPVRVHPSDKLTVASRRVATGSVFTISGSLDRLRVRIDGYAVDEGQGVLEAVVGPVGETEGGVGIPLLFTEADGRPVASVELATRASLEVRVMRCVGTGTITNTSEEASAT